MRRSLQTSSTLQHDALFVHRDSPDDNPDIKFEFTDANKKVCDKFKPIYYHNSNFITP